MLGGSWVVRSRLRSTLNKVTSTVPILILPLLATHQTPSRPLYPKQTHASRMRSGI